jgi:hypothetical protein
VHKKKPREKKEGVRARIAQVEVHLHHLKISSVRLMLHPPFRICLDVRLGEVVARMEEEEG